MTCEDRDYYLLWINPLYYLNYQVSLGWFYLLDIHCDYSLISPFCGVAQTPDCGMLVVHLPVISPLCGVAPTPDCGIIILAVSSRGVIQTLVWHQYYYSCSFLSRSHLDPRLAPSILFWNIFNHMCASWSFAYFVTDV